MDMNRKNSSNLAGTEHDKGVNYAVNTSDASTKGSLEESKDNSYGSARNANSIVGSLETKDAKKLKHNIKKILATSAYEYDTMFKFLVIGDACTGKTSVLLRFTDENFSEAYLCTIGVDFRLRTLKVDNKVIKLQIWDTAGQERFRSVTHSYYRNSQGCLAVYDITNRDSFSNITHLIEHYRQFSNLSDKTPINESSYQARRNSIEPPSHINENIVLVGNKSDLEANRQVSYEEGQRLAERYGIPFFETSAKKDSNVDECFFELTIKAFSEFSKGNIEIEQVTPMQLTRKIITEKKSSGCCK